MGLQQPHGLGRNKRFYVARETTFGTVNPPVAASRPNVTTAPLRSPPNTQSFSRWSSAPAHANSTCSSATRRLSIDFGR